MKKLTLLLTFFFFFFKMTYSQSLLDFGAGAIDFLLKNPKTANRMNPTETVALDIIGDLLKTESQRKHQLEYATAGSNQITINTSDGRNAQFVKTANGQVFLLVDGELHLIASELVYSAQGHFYESKTITGFDINKLRTDYDNSNVALFSFKWFNDLNNDGVGFDEIKNIKNTFHSNENFKILLNYIYKDNGELQKSLSKFNDFEERYNAFQTNFFQELDRLIPHYRALLYNVADAIEKSKIEKEVKQKFLDMQNESIDIITELLRIERETHYMQIKLSIRNNYNGEVNYKDSSYLTETNKPSLSIFNINSNTLGKGDYIVSCVIEDTRTNHVVQINTFQLNIVQGNNSTKEISLEEKLGRELIHYTTPKGLFSYFSGVDRNSDGKLSYDEFENLNSDFYDLSEIDLPLEIVNFGINNSASDSDVITQIKDENDEIVELGHQPFQSVFHLMIFQSYEKVMLWDMVFGQSFVKRLMKDNRIICLKSGRYNFRVSLSNGDVYEKNIEIKW